MRMLRRELLQKTVLDKHLWSWDRAPCYIRAIEPVCPSLPYERFGSADSTVDSEMDK